MESEEQYVSMQFHSKLIYDYWIFDMAKLIDIAAVYGQSNAETVKKMIANVFES
jgi:hypothetical protein